MKMNTHGLNSLEVSLNELTEAFKSLPDTAQELTSYSVKFTLTDDYGNSCERDLLFKWNQKDSNWELDAKAHDLFITA
jgi:hypothetical protein